MFTNAIQDLIHQYGESVFHLVCMIVKNHALAEDITQEVFIKAYRSVESFCGELPCSEKASYQINVFRRFEEEHTYSGSIPIIP
ncbi:sigma factor [Brevibacillus laterosporus]|uniref:sigma factor n=1 Tax=Brevibacillus laterosporus TaxID=1465 RepID=UPI0026734F94|nr:sigma factor [Brevibacillus laterosporus]